jgi:hypothetical protein
MITATSRRQAQQPIYLVGNDVVLHQACCGFRGVIDVSLHSVQIAYT